MILLRESQASPLAIASGERPGLVNLRQQVDMPGWTSLLDHTLTLYFPSSPLHISPYIRFLSTVLPSTLNLSTDNSRYLAPTGTRRQSPILSTPHPSSRRSIPIIP